MPIGVHRGRTLPTGISVGEQIVSPAKRRDASPVFRQRQSTLLLLESFSTQGGEFALGAVWYAKIVLNSQMSPLAALDSGVEVG